MTNLTEQWKNGTLTDGRYYVKLTSGKIIIDDYSHEVFHTIWRNMVKEILAPFPTFEEWQVMWNNRPIEQALESRLKEAEEVISKYADESLGCGPYNAQEYLNKYGVKK